MRAPAVYGPGDRETLAYFRRPWPADWRRSPRLAAARLSLIHVADLAEALALAVERSPPPSTYEIDDGKEGGYTYRRHGRALAGRALGGRRAPVACRATAGDGGAGARERDLSNSLGGSVQILTPDKVEEIFHSDWTVHDRRLAGMLGFHPRYDLAAGFRETILWYREQGWL